MPKWNPKTDPVGKNEPIGRRLYDEPMLVGAHDQPSFTGLDYRHFEETRSDRELSLDRLGCTGIERKVVSYLLPRAIAAGNTRSAPKKFNGWIHVRASTLTKGWKGQSFPVIPSPVDGEEVSDDERNVFHAHVNVGENATLAALYLRELFARNGQIEQPSVENYNEPTQDIFRRLAGLLKDWLAAFR